MAVDGSPALTAKGSLLVYKGLSLFIFIQMERGLKKFV
ncbi:hypothetical protein QY97_00539 [Bacillus thermotolerans]|uniref:Uncharacterized protein n=1 Tax=Bacillus thermotolerans TaxID=1221996 RepID=A0A0F5I4J8_BACTR|nr:hypothetical protein QY97_00539 [Bacillus thermotolerans]KKB40195.1 hypothetical protein QY95_01828 [Bacillus thermotolerans]KKB42597.1 hypothetical protein QY96_01370 [Bacillus thermotolerans]